MRDVNKVILLGRLGSDPDSRQTKAGTPVTHLSVATSRKTYQDSSSPGASPSTTEETQWHRIVVWGKQAEACNQYLKKGHPVYLEGFIRSRQYEDKSGVTKVSYEIQAEQISFLGQKTKTKENGIPEADVIF